MFTIRYQTITFRPDLQVTLRTNVDGWDNDIPGIYEEDEWRFRLPEGQYRPGTTSIVTPPGVSAGRQRSASSLSHFEPPHPLRQSGMRFRSPRTRL